MIGPVSTLFEAPIDTQQSLPYLGLGYSHFWFNSQLSLNADFGLASPGGPWALHPRNLLGNTPASDDITHDLHWLPVMAVNVKYWF